MNNEIIILVHYYYFFNGLFHYFEEFYFKRSLQIAGTSMYIFIILKDDEAFLLSAMKNLKGVTGWPKIDLWIENMISTIHHKAYCSSMRTNNVIEITKWTIRASGITRYIQWTSQHGIFNACWLYLLTDLLHNCMYT